MGMGASCGGSSCRCGYSSPYATRTVEDKKATRASWTPTDVVLSCVVIALILGAYLYFVG